MNLSYKGGLNKKEIQLNLCNLFSVFIFNPADTGVSKTSSGGRNQLMTSKPDVILTSGERRL